MIPTVKLKIPGKAFLKSESRTSVTFNCYMQKLFFIFFTFFHGSVLAKSQQLLLWQIAKVKNYNLNVTEVRDLDFKNAFPVIFNFTVGILTINPYWQHFGTITECHFRKLSPGKFHEYLPMKRRKAIQYYQCVRSPTLGSRR